MKSNKTVLAADLFCGAGGTSTGLRQACEAIGINLKLVAVNHWQLAISTHSANHPEADHHCTSLDNVDPRKLVPGGKLDLLVASPECTHHSRARGGKPINDQSRASAWRITEWASQLEIKHILIENVPDFLTWGPLNAKGKPINSRKGELFNAFVGALKAHGYKVEWKLLTAADYGDPTTRERLFIQARRGNKPITWPEQTHVPQKKIEAARAAFPARSLKPYRPAREIIDWTIPGSSIFTRKKPLAENTMRRIWKGIEKFVGKPFIVPQMSGGANRSVDDPVPTIMTDGGHALCQPFIVVLRNNNTATSLDAPLSTICTSGAHHALVEPFLVRFNGNHQGRQDGAGRVYSVDEPVKTLDTSNRLGLCQPFMIQLDHSQAKLNGHNLQDPMPTVTSSDAWALVKPFIIPVNHGQDTRSHDIDSPMPTITTVDAWALIKPYLVKFNGTADAVSLEDPLDTVTTKDRFGLAQPQGISLSGDLFFIFEVLFRMLLPHELAAAMSFPRTYSFAGTREQKVKQIGNAVPVRTARALCRTILSI